MATQTTQTGQAPRKQGGEQRNRVRHAGSSLPVNPPDQRRNAVLFLASMVDKEGGDAAALRELLDMFGLDPRDGKRARKRARQRPQ
jgi:hypothetical protein